MPSFRPGAKMDIREKYKGWCQKFRLRMSKGTLPLRPPTYRRLFLEKHAEELEG